MKVCSTLLSTCVLLASAPVVGDDGDLELVDVFTSGEEGYHTYRIPALLTTRAGTVLAFAEGRATRSDHAENDMVIKRSDDGGRTWGDLVVVAEDGKNCLNNPCAVEVAQTGRILLMYQRYPHGFHESKVVPGYDDPMICRNFLVHSDDDGKTWSKPREITRQTKRPERATSIAGGPGVGIQMRRGPHKGRLVIPFNEGPLGRGRVYAAYSDDGGETWDYGDPAPEKSPGQGNEVQLVELADGALRLNARSYRGSRLRKTATSRDGGQTWSPLEDVSQLIEPQCMASLIRYSDPLDGRKSRLLFANPASQKGRVNGTVRLSYDDGKTWPVARAIYKEGFAYSCLAPLPDGSIGCFFERDGYRKITLARFSLAWLTEGQDVAEVGDATEGRDGGEPAGAATPAAAKVPAAASGSSR